MGQCISRDSGRDGISRTPSSRARKKARKNEETIEKEKVKAIVKEKYSMYVLNSQEPKLLQIGKRLQKYWLKVKDTSSETSQSELLLSLCPVSKKCALDLTNEETMQTLNKILRKVEQHPYIHSVQRIDYLQEHDKVVVIEVLADQGSLKDYIYDGPKKRQHLKSWDKKYKSAGSSLSRDKIALFGRQILEAIIFLYRKDFPQLGHIDTGNIFIEGCGDGDEKCLLGGYVNTLLGYRSAFHDQMTYDKDIDIIMFGHVIYEMGAGKPPDLSNDELCPDDDDLGAVKDDSVRDVLKYIYDGKGVTISSIKEHAFFNSVVVDTAVLDNVKVKMSHRKKALLNKVTASINTS